MSGMKSGEYIISLLFPQEKKEDDYSRVKLQMARKEKTEKHFNLYHVKNTLKTIIETTKASFIASQGKNINMKSVIAIVLEAEKVYRKFPKKDRLILQQDMINLKTLKDKENLIRILGLSNFIKENEKNKFMTFDFSRRENTKIEYKEKERLKNDNM